MYRKAHARYARGIPAKDVGESTDMTIRPTRTTYVAYQHPGIFLSEESVVRVEVCDPQQQANDAPGSAFAFFYFDVVTTVVYVDGERIVTHSDRCNISSTYYIDAKLMTFSEVASLPGDTGILLSSMRSNKWDSVVRCRTGNVQPFEPDRCELVSTG